MNALTCKGQNHHRNHRIYRKTVSDLRKYTFSEAILSTAVAVDNPPQVSGLTRLSTATTATYRRSLETFTPGQAVFAVVAVDAVVVLRAHVRKTNRWPRTAARSILSMPKNISEEETRKRPDDRTEGIASLIPRGGLNDPR